MSFISGVIVALFLADFAWWWQAHLTASRLPRSVVWGIAVGFFAAVQFGGLAVIVASRLRGDASPVLLPRPVLASVYLWHLLIVLPTLAIWLLIRAGSAAENFLVARSSGAQSHATAFTPRNSGVSRRQFISAVGLAAPAVVTCGATLVSLGELTRFRVRRLEVPCPRLPGALEGLSLAIVSDLHVGRLTHGSILEEVVRATNALAADLVLLPGDLINYDLKDLPAGLAVVRRLQARWGVFMCEGNHDLIEDPEAFREQTRAAGVPLLVNATAELTIRNTPVQLLGLRWGHPGAAPTREAQHGDAAISASMRELLALRHPEAFPILIAHHPHAFDFAGGLPLTISGHTHGGQLMLSSHLGFGPALFRYWSGLYERPDRSLVVSNGVGNWFPLRIGAPAEILHLTLRQRPLA